MTVSCESSQTALCSCRTATQAATFCRCSWSSSPRSTRPHTHRHSHPCSCHLVGVLYPTASPGTCTHLQKDIHCILHCTDILGRWNGHYWKITSVKLRLWQAKSKESQEEERFCCLHVEMDREDKNTLMIINEASQDFIFVHVSLNMISKKYSRKVIYKIIECNAFAAFHFCLCRIIIN